jgi:hypothetical protein
MMGSSRVRVPIGVKVSRRSGEVSMNRWRWLANVKFVIPLIASDGQMTQAVADLAERTI